MMGSGTEVVVGEAIGKRGESLALTHPIGTLGPACDRPNSATRPPPGISMRRL
jgi:hypothetical protein